MASEAIITDDLICRAAEHLSGEGVRPTNETVRELLAKWTGTKGGSYSTIGPVLRTWRAKRKAAEATQPVREPAPQAIVDKVQGWAAEMWLAALDLANARLTAEREALERARADMEVETAEALALAEKREDERDEARRMATEQSQRQNELIQATQEQVRVQMERAAAAGARVAELERRASNLYEDLKTERTQREAAELARRTAEADLARLQGETEALRGQVASQEATIRAVVGKGGKA